MTSADYPDGTADRALERAAAAGGRARPRLEEPDQPRARSSRRWPTARASSPAALDCEDTRVMVEALRTLGIAVEHDPALATIRVQGCARQDPVARGLARASPIRGRASVS